MGAAKVIRDFAIRFGVEVDDKALDGLDKKIVKAKADLNDFVRFAAKGAVAIAGIGAVAIVEARRVAVLSEQIERQAKAIDVSTDAAQELASAFGKFGGDASDVSDIIGTLTDRAEDAKGGMESFIADFRLVGLEVDDLRGKSPIELLETFADAIAGTEDPNKRLAAAVRILGDDIGNKFLPLLLQGADGLARLRQEARDTGEVMDKETLAANKEAAKSFATLMGVLTGLRNELGSRLAPFIKRAADRITAWVKANREFIKQDLAELARLIGAGFEFMLDVLVNVNSFIRDNVGGWTNLFKGFAFAVTGLGIVKGIVAIQSALIVLGEVLAAAGITAAVPFTPALLTIALVTLAVALLLLGIEDLVGFIQGKDSLIGRFFDTFGEGDTIFDSLAQTLRAAGDAMRLVMELFEDFQKTPLGKFVGELATEFGRLGGFLLDLPNIIAGGAFRLFIVLLQTALDLTTETIKAWTDFFGASGSVFAGDDREFGGGIPDVLGTAARRGAEAVLPPAAVGGLVAAAQTTSITNTDGGRSVNLGNTTFNITSPNPEEAAKAVQRVFESVFKQAADTFNGGDV